MSTDDWKVDGRRAWWAPPSRDVGFSGARASIEVAEDALIVRSPTDGDSFYIPLGALLQVLAAAGCDVSKENAAELDEGRVRGLFAAVSDRELVQAVEYAQGLAVRCSDKYRYLLIANQVRLTLLDALLSARARRGLP